MINRIVSDPEYFEARFKALLRRMRDLEYSKARF